MSVIRTKLTMAAVAAWLSCTAVSAAGQPSNLEQAKTYFNAGAKAYQAGMFSAAIQAFEKAYELAPKPAILFTIGQAYRRQYYLDKNVDNLKQAITHYRKYIRLDPKGRRRADAAEALAELEPIWKELQQATQGEEGEEATKPTGPQSPRIAAKTRLMITSPTPGAKVSVDGASPVEAPFIGEIKKGKHRVTVLAPGYFEQSRQVDVAEGAVLALDIQLKAKPAKLLVWTENGAEVSIDGRYVGVTPLSRGIDIAPGNHQVVVLRNGRKAFAVRVIAKRGKTIELHAPLEVSTQRVTSWVFLSTAGVAFVSGGLLAAVALKAQDDAQSIATRASKQNIGAFDLNDYNDALDRRDRARMAASLSFGVGAVVGGIGAWLYGWDMPSTPRGRTLETIGEKDSKKKQSDSQTLRMSVSPYGVGIRGSF